MWIVVGQEASRAEHLSSVWSGVQRRNYSFPGSIARDAAAVAIAFSFVMSAILLTSSRRGGVVICTAGLEKRSS
jgi:hypothetical protein